MGHLLRNWLYCVGFEAVLNHQKAQNVMFALNVTAQQTALGSSPRAVFAWSMELRTASMRMPLPGVPRAPHPGQQEWLNGMRRVPDQVGA